MSSQEIADLLGNRHDKVKQSIERLANRGVISHPPMGDDLSIDAQGKERVTKIYRLDKRSSLIVVAQLSPEFTAKVVDRWQELEEAEARNLPTVTDALVAALAERLVPTLGQLVTARIASTRIQQRRGETAGEIARRWNLPRLKSLATWLGNRLEDAGVPVVGRGDLGTSKARTFDPDAADDAMKAGVNALALRYVNTKLGAANDNDLFSRLAI